jgi:hypothetical protein
MEVYTVATSRTSKVDKKGNFKRIAEARTNKLLDALSLLGNLSNKSYYEYSQEQVDAIFNAIQEELDNQRKRFSEEEHKKKKFRL